MQLTDKISDTDTRIGELDDKFRRALHEQAIRLENKQKELHLEWRKDLKDVQKQINDNLDEKLMVIKQEQDNKIQTVNEMLQATTNKTLEIETRIIIIEDKIGEISKTAEDCSGEISHMKEEVKSEMKQLREELRRRPTRR